MLNYMRSELYRISHKKSAGIGLIVVALCGLLPADVVIVFGLLSPMVIGTLLFTATYTDDLTSKRLVTLIGFGLGRVKIFLSKLIIMAVLTAAAIALAAVLRFALGSLWSESLFTVEAQTLLLAALQGYMCIMIYSTLC